MPRHLPRPLQDPKELSEIEKVLKRVRESDTIGDLVTWSCDRLEITPDDLTALLKKRGIEKWAPVEIRKKTAARKAITQIRPLLEEGELRVIVRRVRENDEEVRYAIVNEMADLDRLDLDYSTRNQVVFNKRTGDLSFTQEEIPEIREKFEYLCGVYTQREVLMMVQNIVLGYGGIPLGDNTGMYFMPVAVRHITDALDELMNLDLAGVYGQASFRAFGVINDEREKVQMGDAFRTDIMAELKEAHHYVEKVMSDPNVRPASLQNALARFRTAQGKALMYRELLQLDLAEMEENMRIITEKIESALMVPAS